MPKRPEIQRVLIVGSGPIVIGQACEFDYSGTQACRSLREEGIGVVLLNSNPATIMTDPELADRTYIEPITPETIERILKRERDNGSPVDSLLPTLGGQTGLNCALAAAEQGILERYGVALIGADTETIRRAEDRERYKETVQAVGVEVARSVTVRNMAEARAALQVIGLPICVRPAYTLGGAGGGFARTETEFEALAQSGLGESPISQVLIEEDLTGWKEFEFEMMRDGFDNVVVVCSIENFDAMGVHTGDSITVAPAMTLTDKEFQRMRDASIAIMRAVGVSTGGANIQYAVNPQNGRMVTIEMNPRVSRSSALASKATGFPIAKLAAKLAVGYGLHELRNDITRETAACFEPVIDYCVVKMPRFTFEKFPEADATLTTSMKSVGEAMAIGRTFKEAFQKCIRSMEIKRPGYGLHRNDRWLEARRGGGAVAEYGDRDTVWYDAFGHTTTEGRPVFSGSTLVEAPADWEEESAAGWPVADNVLVAKIGTPCQGRIYYIRYALKLGWSVERIHELSGIDPWFLDQLAHLVAFEDRIVAASPPRSRGERLTADFVELFQEARRLGYSEDQLRTAWGMDEPTWQWLRGRLDRPVYKLVDTCAAEFEAFTPYYYSTRERPVARVAFNPAAVVEARDHRGASSDPDSALARLGIDAVYRTRVLDDENLLVESHDGELDVTDRPKVVIIGGGPNRIGQGIEFDYCCVHAAMAAGDLDFETAMINSNPETVSTDYDTSDLLFFEPLTLEDTLNVCERLNGGAFRRERLSFDLEPRARLGADIEAAFQRYWRNAGLGPGVAVDQMRGGGAVGPLHVGYVVATRDGRVWSLDTDKHGQVTRFELKSPAIIERMRDKIERVQAQLAARPDLVRGVIVQFGGQTPLNLAEPLSRAGVPILGTAPDDIHLAEDRERFQQILNELGLRQPPNGTASSRAEAIRVAEMLEYPVLVRPSYVLGGRGMQICNNADDLNRYIDGALRASDRELVIDQRHPILIEKFLLDAVEVDVDAVSDYGLPGRDAAEGRCDICGIMEHIEEAGIHSGDSSCVLPPYSLSPALIDEIKYQVKVLARRLRVCGLMNVQFAIQGRVVYLIEVNPRASRTVPFVSKATGVPWAKIATRVMLGQTLDEALGGIDPPDPAKSAHVAVKAPVFPFKKLRTVDVVLGPEMRSTGEVMGIDRSYPMAFAKALQAAGINLPTSGRVLVSVNDADKPRVISIARELHEMGFEIFSTRKTRDLLAEHGIPAQFVSKQSDDKPPFLLDLIRERKLDLLINTPIHTGSATDEGRWRVASIQLGIPLITTLAGARAAVDAIRALRTNGSHVAAIQDYIAAGGLS